MVTSNDSAERRWMIYGATGYTGRLCAREAVRRGMRPVLGGRNPLALNALASELKLEAREFSLDDPRVVADNLGGISAVLHCAGPFSATSIPMLSACEHAHCHYFDITGEIDVFEYVHARDAHWKNAVITVMPGVGFDVVPTDCLAAMVKRAMPEATHLKLAFRGKRSKMSPGTAKTSAEGMHKGTRFRKNGQITSAPTGSMTAMIPFTSTPELAVAIPWGDVSTAYHSTKIPNIEVYTGIGTKQLSKLKWAGRLAPLLRLGVVQQIIKNNITKNVHGPTDEERAAGSTQLWAEGTDAQGRRVAYRMQTPEGYTLTVDASLTILQRALNSRLPIGALTPSMAFGPDFVLELSGVKLEQV